MRIEIDTDQKTVKVEATQNLNKLVKELKKLLGDEWKEYNIDSGYNPWWYTGTTYIPATWDSTGNLITSDLKMTTNQ